MSPPTLRQLTTTDAAMVYALIEESRAYLKNLVWSQESTLASTTDFLAAKVHSTDKVFGIFVEDVFVGVLELRDKGDAQELGYWLGASYRHRGIMKHAVKLLVDDVVFQKPVIAHIRVGNVASHHTLSYAGLTTSHTELWQGEEWLHLRREAPVADFSTNP